MKRALIALLVAGCATVAPRELTDARAAYEASVAGPSGKLTPADLYEARKALDAANQRFAEEGDTDAVRDLAYIARRRTQLADAHARAEQSRQQLGAIGRSAAVYRDQQMQAARRDLDQTRERLVQQQRTQEKTAAELEAERKARTTAEGKLEKAMRDLATVAAVKEESRGVVITLSGSVLFAPGRSSLLQTAQARLDQVAQTLREEVDGHRIVVEGHTDSLGSEDYNQQLSMLRAMAVRDYLVTQGVKAEKIVARGFGESRPLVENSTPENRANNRRVEIVIEPVPAS